jgi:N-acetylneuraminic acid mutarotase
LITGSGPEANNILRYHSGSDSWEILDIELESNRDHSAITLAGDDLYIISGRGGGTEVPRVDILNLTTFEFRQVPDLPTPRGGHVAEYLNGKVYVIGGEVGGDTPFALDNVEVFDTEQGVWIEGPLLPYTIHGLASAQHDGRIYLIGGATGAFFETFETLTGYNYVLNLQ